MESEGPYNPYKHQTEMWGTKECDKQCKACIYAEGRKAAENYTEKMLKIATNEVRKCHGEIRRLEDKLAHNAPKIQAFNTMEDFKLDTAEKLAIAIVSRAQGRNEADGKDFQELLDMANKLRRFAMGNFEPEAREFDAWKKARGLE